MRSGWEDGSNGAQLVATASSPFSELQCLWLQTPRAWHMRPTTCSLCPPHTALSSQPSWGLCPGTLLLRSIHESGDSLGVNRALALHRGCTVRIPAPTSSPHQETRETCCGSVVMYVRVCVPVCVCVVSMCLIVFVHVFVYVCLYVSSHVSVVSICTEFAVLFVQLCAVDAHVCICMCPFACVHFHVSMCMQLYCVCTSVSIYIYRYVCLYIYVSICVCVCLYGPVV